MKRSAQAGSTSTRNRTPEDDVETEEQDVRFIDVPSERSRSGSKAKRTLGSASQRAQENGKKAYKTVNPEDVVSLFYYR